MVLIPVLQGLQGIFHSVRDMTCNDTLAKQLHSTEVLVGCPVKLVSVLETAGTAAVCTQLEARAALAEREERKEGR